MEPRSKLPLTFTHHGAPRLIAYDCSVYAARMLREVPVAEHQSEAIALGTRSEPPPCSTCKLSRSPSDRPRSEKKRQSTGNLTSGLFS